MKRDWRNEFPDLGEAVWLNAASEGPLPRRAVTALEEAIRWKTRPEELTLDKFARIPKQLKESIGRLIHVQPRDVILANSASYGIHLLANGFPWAKGDEVIVSENDFPTDILPWLGLGKQGVVVRQISAAKNLPSADEVEQAMTPQTRLVCLSQVHSFSGEKLDVEGISRLCREKNVTFVLNITQAAGNTPIDLSKTHADAVVCAGYKWLCGPVGTGFFWMTPELRKSLDLNVAYWSVVLSGEELEEQGPLRAKDISSARKYDVFGTANFFNFVPWRESIELLLDIGIDNIRTYHDEMMQTLVDGVRSLPYTIISPAAREEWSSLFVFSHQKSERNQEILQGLKMRNIHGTIWKGRIRLTPHIYTRAKDLALVLDALKELA